LTPSFNSFNSHFANTQTWRLFNISNTRPTLLYNSAYIIEISVKMIPWGGPSFNPNLFFDL
jgi:hypothetical protein